MNARLPVRFEVVARTSDEGNRLTNYFSWVSDTCRSVSFLFESVNFCSVLFFKGLWIRVLNNQSLLEFLVGLLDNCLCVLKAHEKLLLFLFHLSEVNMVVSFNSGFKIKLFFNHVYSSVFPFVE